MQRLLLIMVLKPFFVIQRKVMKTAWHCGHEVAVKGYGTKVVIGVNI